MKSFLRITALLAAFMIVFVGALAIAQTPKKSDAQPTAPSLASPVSAEAPKGHELTAEDLGSFLDGLMPIQIERADIAGVVVAVTKDGKLLFTKGYGYADVDKKTPVLPDTTLFRPGSISKTFTWTAVMQQVEQGKLDLDRDVNDYLDFKIPPAFGKPITLRNIMTHSTGFEETVKDLFIASDKDLRPIGEYLQVHMPARIFPPGTTPAYSNYATTMAAYIVERVSGQKFDDYVEEHFFKPLNMQHATFRQPLPEALKSSMSSGYVTASQPAKPFEVVQVAPAGALSASAVDMTHWMIMHLQNGKYGDVQILKPETAIQMHARQNGWPPAINAMALGFYEESRNGHRIIGHGGDTLCFHSDMHLILDSNVGFFVSFNSAGKDPVASRSVLFDKFMERYFPVAPPNEPVLSTAAQDAQSVAGVYTLSRRFETNVLAVTGLLGQANVVANPKDHTISLDLFKNLNAEPKHFEEIAPLVFRAVGGHEKIVFVNDASGRRVAYIDYPFMVFQQVNSLLDRKNPNLFLIGFAFSVIVLSILLWPIAVMLRKHYGKPLALSAPSRRLRWLVRIVCLAVIAFGIGVILFVNKLNDLGGLSESGDFSLHLLQVLGLLAGLGSIFAVINCLKSWGDGEHWFWYKLWNTFQAFACVGFFWFIYHWHLLNFHLNY